PRPPVRDLRVPGVDAPATSEEVAVAVKFVEGLRYAPVPLRVRPRVAARLGPALTSVRAEPLPLIPRRPVCLVPQVLNPATLSGERVRAAPVPVRRPQQRGEW